MSKCENLWTWDAVTEHLKINNNLYIKSTQILALLFNRHCFNVYRQCKCRLRYIQLYLHLLQKYCVCVSTLACLEHAHWLHCTHLCLVLLARLLFFFFESPVTANSLLQTWQRPRCAVDDVSVLWIDGSEDDDSVCSSFRAVKRAQWVLMWRPTGLLALAASCGRMSSIRDRWIMRLCAPIILRIIGDLAHNWASPA